MKRGQIFSTAAISSILASDTSTSTASHSSVCQLIVWVHKTSTNLTRHIALNKCHFTAAPGQDRDIEKQTLSPASMSSSCPPHQLTLQPRPDDLSNNSISTFRGQRSRPKRWKRSFYIVCPSYISFKRVLGECHGYHHNQAHCGGEHVPLLIEFV